MEFSKSVRSSWVAMAALAVVAVGCGGDDAKPANQCPSDFVVNQQEACTCDEEGSTGFRVCQEDRTFGECDCSGGGAGTTAPIPTGGSGGSAGTTGGSGSGGDEDGGTDPGQSGSGGTGGTGGSEPPAPTKPATDGSQLAACLGSGECTDGRACYTATVAGAVGYCTETCQDNADCEALGDGYSCSSPSFSSRTCRLSCTGPDDDSCPQFMKCFAVQAGPVTSHRCLYEEKSVGEGKTAIWEPCNLDGDCKEGLVCFNVPSGATSTHRGYCTQTCSNSNQCTDNPTGEVAPTCGMAGECQLNCAGTGLSTLTCPDGMECVSIGGAGPGTRRCLYKK